MSALGNALTAILGLTGGPGTGKKTIAPLAAGRLGLGCISLNELALAHGLVKAGVREGEVDTRRMRREVSGEIPAPSLVFGHLLPYVLDPASLDRVVVLRCDPRVLKTRLAERGYPPRKVTENVEAELIGVVSADAYDAFGGSRTFEVDTSRSSPAAAAEEVAGAFRGSPRTKPRIDWTGGYDSGEKLRSLLSEA